METVWVATLSPLVDEHVGNGQRRRGWTTRGQVVDEGNKRRKVIALDNHTITQESVQRSEHSVFT